jgi:signal transduction histidine kinase
MRAPPQEQVATVRGTQASLRRAILALTDNALHHARHTVSVTVSVRRKVVVVEVADDGPGIDPAIAARLFERFASTGHSEQDGTPRYGLGLALVNEIASRHDGQVEVDGRPGRGATFRLILPATNLAD